MNEDIICLLQDLGKENSVEVIANFMIRNPEIEELIAAKMGSILSNSNVTSPASTSQQDFSSLISNSLSLAMSGIVSGSHKMIFIVNMELNMGRGKQCAQVAHAALGLYLKIQEKGNKTDLHKISDWLAMGEKKIVVRGNDLKQMKAIQQEADEARLPNLFVSDAGCTQIAPGSKTVLAIFGSNDELDRITGSLKLL